MSAAPNNDHIGQKPGLITTTIIFSGSILSTLITMAILPAMPEMSRTIAQGENSALMAQLITTLPAAVMALSSPFAGVAVKKFGFRRYLAMSFLLYLIAGLAALIAPNIETLLASRFFMGLAGGGIAALPFALAGHFAPEVRDRLIGFATSAGGIAGIISLNAGGALVDMVGWRAPFALYALAALFLVCALVDRTLGRMDIKESPASSATRSAGGESILPLMPLYVLLFTLSVGFYVPSLAGPFLLEMAGIATGKAQGGYLSVFALSSIMAASAFGWLVKRIGRFGAAAAAALSLAAGITIMAFLLSPLGFALGFALCGIGAGWAAPAVISEILMQASSALLPKAMGLKATAIFIAQFATPFFLHVQEHAFGLIGAFYGTSLLMLAAALWSVWNHQRGQKLAAAT